MQTEIRILYRLEQEKSEDRMKNAGQKKSARLEEYKVQIRTRTQAGRRVLMERRVQARRAQRAD